MPTASMRHDTFLKSTVKIELMTADTEMLQNQTIQREYARLNLTPQPGKTFLRELDFRHHLDLSVHVEEALLLVRASL